MADSKITALTALTAADPANDMLPVVDVSDTSMAASGTTKRISINNILACSPSATLASLNVTGSSMPANGLYLPTTNTLEFSANTLAQYRIAPLGVFSWYDGAGGTRMTLNATGLGVGVSPAYKLDVRTAPATAAIEGLRVSDATRMMISGQTGATYSYIGIGGNQNVIYSSNSRLDIAADGQSIFLRSSAANYLNLDASGNVGISVTPSAWQASWKALDISTIASVWGNVNTSIISNNVFFDGALKYKTAIVASYLQQQSKAFQFFQSSDATPVAGGVAAFTQAMTLDASGNLLLGKTTTAATALGGVAYIGRVDCSRDTGNAATFNHTTAGNLVGNIAITSTATTYNSASDYRLKESVQPLSGGLARVSALKPSIYKWKVDGSSGEGFLAHELADVVPLAVTGEKDAVDADGKPEYQGVDLSKVVPILVAAIQELTARVQTLETR